jgi:tripartite motif-containing protein 71
MPRAGVVAARVGTPARAGASSTTIRAVLPRFSRSLVHLLRSLSRALPSRAFKRTPPRPGRHCELPLLLPVLLPLALLLAAVLVCAGCGGQSSSRVALLRACPGAVGAVCPYTGVRTLGRRGAGVLRCPEALAFAPDGDLYVADQFSHVVQRFSPSGRFLGQWGSFGSGPGQFGAVDGLAVAPSGDVYVLDSTHARVERFSASGRLLGEWGRPGRALGEFDFGPGFGPDKPPGGGLAVGGGFVYVSDTAANRIVRFRLDGSDPVLWGRPGSAPGRFSSPRGLAVAGGVVYVADEGNHRVQALALDGRPLYAEGSFGTGPGQFVNPFGVAVHGGRVYVVDDNNNRLVVLTRDLRYVEEWSGDGPFHLSYIRAAAVSPSGRVFVADTGHERVVAFDPYGRGLLAFGTPGTAPGQFVAPLGVAVDAAGDVVVVETYGSRSPIYRFDSSLRYLGEWQRGGGAIIGSHWFGPTAAAVAPDGSVWVTDPHNGLVRHLSSAGAFLAALGVPAAPGSPVAPPGVGAGAYASGSGSASASGGSGGEGSASGGAGGADALLEPLGVALSPSGAVVYVADTGAGRVVRFTSSGQPLGVFGSVAFVRPVALAVGPGGVVYVADAGLRRVFELSPAGALLASWGGSGSAPGRFLEPAGLAVDSAGHVFVSDRRAARVQEFSSGGRFLAAWGAPGGGPGELSAPSGLAVDCWGDVLVADTANNRVLLFAGAASRGVCAPASRAPLGA